MRDGGKSARVARQINNLYLLPLPVFFMFVVLLLRQRGGGDWRATLAGFAQFMHYTCMPSRAQTLQLHRRGSPGMLHSG